jgi:hypothetical protein
MGIPLPIFDINRPVGSIKEYLILLYLDLVSSEYYKNGKSFLLSLYLWWYSAQLCYNKKFFYIPFSTAKNMYKIPIILGHNNNVVKITDEKGNCLDEYAGPGKNFYGIKLRPKDLDCKSIIITYDNGEEDKLIDEYQYVTGV